MYLMKKKKNFLSKCCFKVAKQSLYYLQMKKVWLGHRLARFVYYKRNVWFENNYIQKSTNKSTNKEYQIIIQSYEDLIEIQNL